MMAYINNNSLSNNLEIDLLRSAIIIVTVIFTVLGFITDGNPYIYGFSLWMYFIALSPVIFMFTLFLKKYPSQAIILLLACLFMVSVFFKDYVFFYNLKFDMYKTSLVVLHFTVITFFFVRASKTLKMVDVEADLSMIKKGVSKTVGSRKLARRKNRRASSKARNTVKIKSGQYRG